MINITTLLDNFCYKRINLRDDKFDIAYRLCAFTLIDVKDNIRKQLTK